MTSKIFILIISVCMGCLFLSANTLDTLDEISLYDSGDGHGEQGGAEPRSLPLSPVKAKINGMKIDVNFITNVGNVTITIKDNNGTYYSDSVDTANSNKNTIDISVLAPGEYTITIVSADGKLDKYGKFEVD